MAWRTITTVLFTIVAGGIVSAQGLRPALLIDGHTSPIASTGKASSPGRRNGSGYSTTRALGTAASTSCSKTSRRTATRITTARSSRWGGCSRPSIASSRRTATRWSLRSAPPTCGASSQAAEWRSCSGSNPVLIRTETSTFSGCGTGWRPVDPVHEPRHQRVCRHGDAGGTALEGHGHAGPRVDRRDESNRLGILGELVARSGRRESSMTRR